MQIYFLSQMYSPSILSISALCAEDCNNWDVANPTTSNLADL